MADRQLPSIDLLRQLLRYDPETGRLFWRERPLAMFRDSSYGATATRSAEWSAKKWNSRHAGKEAFTADDGGGYRRGQIFGGLHRGHRVIWAVHFGVWPEHEIDHINGDKSDNRISNLRAATSSENAWNKSAYVNNTSGFKGVAWNEKAGKWAANIKVFGVQKHIGYFDTPDEAHKAYCSAAAADHGDFARTV